jgi:NTE family protein
MRARPFTKLAFLLACLSIQIATQTVTASEEPPRIGLVLSGGGARGLAHIGVIRALEERNIKIHAITGTSMGAIVGALYASGKTPDELEAIATGIDWSEAFSDEPSRDQLSYRRKQDARDYLSKTQATLDGGVINLPKGVIQGQNLQIMLQRLFVHVSQITDFDYLKIPFRAVASDLVTGEAVVFSSGSIATAVRASMSIPGLFAPVEINGKVLVDGGISNNLPVDIARSMGVDYIIAVDIATPLYSAVELDSVIPIIEQLTTLLTFNQLRKQYALLGPGDVLINPNLKDINTADFNKTALAISRGYAAISNYDEALAFFASPSTATYAATSTYSKPVITEISFDNSSDISDKLIASHISQPLNTPLNRAQLEADIRSIYGYEYFEAVNYAIHSAATGSRLAITTAERSWGKDLLGVSFELNTNSRSENAYNIGANYRKSGITSRGGEWFSVAQIGEAPLLRTELYLPMDYQQRFFAAPYLRYGERSVNNVAESNIENLFRIKDFVKGVFLATEISNVAIAGIGIEHHQGETKTFIGQVRQTQKFSDRVDYLKFELDTLDSLYFPRAGSLASINLNRVSPGEASNEPFELLKFSGVQAVPWGDNSIILRGKYVRSFGNVVGRQFQSSLGGFANLSGLYEDALVGDDLAYLSITYLRRIDEKSMLPVDLPVYLLISVEAGNVWQSPTELSFDDLIYSGLVALGVDSPLGPVYVGYGHSENNQSSFYLKLGRIF